MAEDQATSSPDEFLRLAIQVLASDDPDDHPGVFELLFAVYPETGLPMWWPAYNPYDQRPWTDLSERRSVLAERLGLELGGRYPAHPFTPGQRRRIVKAFLSVSQELHSMGFDTPE
jgi:hypothetical protein